ncbi:MAG TPA: hypothetical protein VM243_04860 [Phycisphaerae bacterium]|nr:hypothetical protein [Phycisphaerae bacterium]
MRGTIRKSLIVLLAGVVFQFGGCGYVIRDLALSAAWEFVWDNDVVFDFFGDDGPGLLTQ